MDIEKMDTCLLGQTIGEVIQKLKIDTSQFIAFDEPPMILRGLSIHIDDSCSIRLYVERTSITHELASKKFTAARLQYLYIIDKKIIGVSWKKEKSGKQKSIRSAINY